MAAMSDDHRSTRARGAGLEAFEVATIGFPFCGFKLLAGLSVGGAAGAALAALGALDAATNAVNLLSLAARGRRAAPTCVLSLLGTALAGERAGREWGDLGSALDVALAFALVAFMIGAGRIAAQPPRLLAAWNACVILNVLGAGTFRVADSWGRLPRGNGSLRP